MPPEHLQVRGDKASQELTQSSQGTAELGGVPTAHHGCQCSKLRIPKSPLQPGGPLLGVGFLEAWERSLYFKKGQQDPGGLPRSPPASILYSTDPQQDRRSKDSNPKNHLGPERETGGCFRSLCLSDGRGAGSWFYFFWHERQNRQSPFKNRMSMSRVLNLSKWN